MDVRQRKGLEIALCRGIYEKNPGVWIVPSQTSNQKYIVRTTEKGPVCNCIDCELRRTICKHIWAVTYVDVWLNPEDFLYTDPLTLKRINGKACTEGVIEKKDIKIKRSYEF